MNRYSRRSHSVIDPESALAALLASRQLDAPDAVTLSPTCSTADSTVSPTLIPPVKAQFLKTQMCAFFLQGKCPLSTTDCRFCHSPDEVRASPDLSKTKLCPKGSKCKRPGCMYAHDLLELRGTAGFFKTQICKFYDKTGYCALERNCRFAHGEEELQTAATPVVAEVPEFGRRGSVCGRRVSVSGRRGSGYGETQVESGEVVICPEAVFPFAGPSPAVQGPQSYAPPMYYGMYIPEIPLPIEPERCRRPSVTLVPVVGRRYSACPAMLPMGFGIAQQPERYED